MRTYEVTLSNNAGNFDIKIVRADNCAQAERKALKAANDRDLHVSKIEELKGDFVD